MSITSPFSDTLLPTLEIPLQETASQSDLAASLDAVVLSRLPGFVVRHGGLSGVAPGNNLELRQSILEILQDSGRNFQAYGTVLSLFATETTGPGPLHTDRRSEKSVETITVHTTTTGSGKVLLAESGPHAPQIANVRAYVAILSRSILAGETDPTIVRPELHTAQLNPGDNVIFALANDRGPIWHRFDTSSAPRGADVSNIELLEA